MVGRVRLTGAMATPTVNDLLEGHVGLDIESLDRVYLNGCLQNLQVGGQVVSFMTPRPEPARARRLRTPARRRPRLPDPDRLPPADPPGRRSGRGRGERGCPAPSGDPKGRSTAERWLASIGALHRPVPRRGTP
jgi:hypothetical protein